MIWTPERRALQARVMNRLNADPEFKVKRSAGARLKWARNRGGAIPEGYQDEYRRLIHVMGIPAPEALRIIRQQRGRDLR